MIRSICNLAVLSAALLLAGCGGAAFMDAQDAPAVEVSGSALNIERLWSRDVGAAGSAAHRLEPLLAGERLVVASGSGRVTALAPDNGEVLWETRLDAPISGGPGGNAQQIALGTADGEIITLAAADGRVQWRTSVSSEVLAPPVVGQDSVVARTADGRVFALDGATGEQRWLYSRSLPTLSLRGHSAAVLVRDGVVAGFDNGRLSALDLASGNPAWEATVAVPEGRTDLERMIDIDADPLVDAGDLFAGAYQGRLAGMALASGEIAWARDISVLGGLAIDASNLYATDEQGRVWALDRTNGASVWRSSALAGLRLGAPVRHAGQLAVVGADGFVTWLATNDGRVMARYRVGNARIVGAPAVAGDRLYVLDLAGRLQALKINQED